VKVGYQYYFISGILFFIAAIYLFWNNQTIQALETNNIPSKSISFLIGLWGIFRFYKGYQLYNKQQHDNNEK